MRTPSVIVIGAGIGGITVAAHLARRGMHVTILEKNSQPGGRCGYFAHKGHHFDTGPTLLIMPLVYEAEFAALGASLRAMLELQQVDPTYHLVFDDASQLTLTSELQRMREQLELIETGSYQGFLRYMEEGNRHYRLAMEHLVQVDFRTAAQFFNLSNLSLITHIKPLQTHYRNMSAYFKHPRLKAAFTFQDLYMGLSPFEAPATFSLLPYSELAHGVWYPKGGMYQVVEALAHLARQAGVEFVFDARVERIEVNGARARGVTLVDGRRLESDVIVANADLPYVYQHLLPEDRYVKKLSRKRFSCSVISFFWSVDRQYTQLGPHTLFLADNYQENFESIIQDLDLPQNPSLYVHAPARLDASMAPVGEDTLIAILPVGHLGEGVEPPRATRQAWNEMRQRARQAVFNRLKLIGIDDLQGHIQSEVCYLPQSWHRRYNLLKGSTHGLCHNLTQLAYFRPKNRHSRYHNLYFVGASTHPGAGIPTAMVSARLTANRILDDVNCSH